MNNIDKWTPTKYVFKKDKLTASRETSQVHVGSRLITDRIAGFYDKAISAYIHGGALCDLGCGTAPLYIKYKDYADEVVLVDWDNSFHDNQYLDYTCDLSKPLPFKDETFDSIILSDVLEHIPNPAQLLNEIYRCLKSRGVLLLNVPFFYWIHEAPHDYFRFTEHMLRIMADEANLTLLQIESIGGYNSIMADLLAKKFASKKSAFGFWVSDIIQRIALNSDKKKRDKTRWLFPHGYFLTAYKLPDNEKDYAEHLIFYGAGARCKEVMRFMDDRGLKLPDEIWDVKHESIKEINNINVVAPRFVSGIEKPYEILLIICIDDENISKSIGRKAFSAGIRMIMPAETYKAVCVNNR